MVLSEIPEILNFEDLVRQVPQLINFDLGLHLQESLHYVLHFEPPSNNFLLLLFHFVTQPKNLASIDRVIHDLVFRITHEEDAVLDWNLNR